jgi:DNA replication protein DnaC
MASPACAAVSRSRCACYQRAATIVTTNLAFKEWGKLFHNSAAASAIADRPVHKGLLIRIQGKSRRSDQEVE